MNISSVSSTNSNYSSGNDSTIVQLESQRTALQKELQSVNQSKEDEKTKEQKMQQIQMQIQQIDAQIQQLKAKRSSGNGQNEQPSAEKNSIIISESSFDVQA